MRRHAICDNTVSGTRKRNQSSHTNTAHRDASCAACASRRVSSASRTATGSLSSWSGIEQGGRGSTARFPVTSTSAGAATVVHSRTYICDSPRVMSS
jgi:hypothetical protein